jgi:hypothetical protein
VLGAEYPGTHAWPAAPGPIGDAAHARAQSNDDFLLLDARAPPDQPAGPLVLLVGLRVRAGRLSNACAQVERAARGAAWPQPPLAVRVPADATVVCALGSLAETVADRLDAQGDAVQRAVATKVQALLGAGQRPSLFVGSAATRSFNAGRSCARRD